MKIYTRTGDDGTTGLLYGGRVPKDSQRPEAYGDVDEAQAALGVARAIAGPDSVTGELLKAIERDLWVLMSELATAEENQHKLTDGASRVTEPMVGALEELIDEVSGRFDPPTEFVVPGQNPLSAQLDVARTVVRRAERSAISVAAPSSSSVPYLNRLSDLLWTLARASDGESLTTRSVSTETRPPGQPEDQS